MAAEGGTQPKTGSRRFDKRVNRRTRRRLAVRYGTTDTNKTAFTKNVSDTGLFLQTGSVLRPGTTLQVEVVFPETSFKMWARVVWAKKVSPELAHMQSGGMGICFIDPPAEWIEYYHSWARKIGI